MSYGDIDVMLLKIEAAISTYDDDELSAKTREAGNDFFAFMASKGVDPGWCAKLILETLKIHPKSLHKSEDFHLLRCALNAYACSIGVIPLTEKMHPHKGKTRNAKDTADFFFNRRQKL